MPLDPTPGTATGPQKWRLGKLANERDLSKLNEEQRSWLLNTDNYQHLSKAKASEIIELLLAAPIIQTQPAEQTRANKDEAKSPDQGYYFIVDTTVSPPRESFFRVQKGKPDTRWAGYTFLSIQASDDFYAIKDPVRRQNIFDIINENPIQAMNEYGIRLGVCGMCGRTLTDRDSRLRGIGPICAGKIPATDEEINLLSNLGLIS